MGPVAWQRDADLPDGRLLGAGAARGSEKKSSPPPSFTCPSLPRATLLGFGASSSMIWLNANRLGALLPATRVRTMW